jgi:deoxyribodipyrimidine photo-lyase
VAAAKARLYGLRRTHEAHAEADAIQHKHGSRKSGLAPTATRTRRGRVVPDGQAELF